MDLISIDQLNDDALALTEKLIDNVSRAISLTRKECMEVRQSAFPLVSRYLASDQLSYHTSISVLNTLIDKADRWSLQNSDNGGVYPISQKDINDGLKSYSDSDEFRNLIKSIHGGFDGWGQPQGASNSKARKALYNFVIAEFNGTEEKSKLDAKLDAHENGRNDAIFKFHAQRIVAILRQQPGAFFPPAKKTKKNQKDQAIEDSAESTAQDLKPTETFNTVNEVVKQIEELMEEATQYRVTVLNSAEMTVEEKAEPAKTPAP